MWRDISHFAIPNGPGGRTPPYAVAFSHGLMKYSKNQKAAKEFLKWIHGKDMFGKWFEIEHGYAVGATTSWESNPMSERLGDALNPFRLAPRGTRVPGHAAPPAAEA